MRQTLGFANWPAGARNGKGFINGCETVTPALFNAGKCGLNVVLGGYCGGFSENEHAVWRVTEAWNGQDLACGVWDWG